MSAEPSHAPCPKCGAAIPTDAPRGLCPRCMILGVATPSEPGLHGHRRIQPPPLATVAAAFPDLEVLELVGVGGMGVVYKARQPRPDRIVALKLLPESLSADPAFAERFDREARFLARLTHPNIVAVHDFGRAGGFCYLMMEFVDGMNLRQAMRAGRFTPDEALALVPRVCGALQYAHEHGVLHRDIKPENILLDADGTVKIADFGIAKLLGDDPADITLTVSGARLGTPHYMAPEQIEKPSQVDHRADIYSLGVVFYELLTGELPLGRFSAPSVKALIDGRVDEIVMRALAKERELRQQSAGEVGTQVAGLTSTVAAETRRAGRRNGHWAGFRVVDSRHGKPSPHWPGIAGASLAGLPLLYLSWGLLLLTLGSQRHPIGLLFVAAAWLVFALLGCHRAWERFDPSAPARDPLPELPKWVRQVAIGLAVVAGLGLLRFAWERLAPPPATGFRNFTFFMEPMLLLFSIALWTRHRVWRRLATLITALFAALLTVAGLVLFFESQAVYAGMPRPDLIESLVGLILIPLFPIGLATVWHPIVSRTFEALDPQPWAPQGSTLWKTWFGWGSIGLGSALALWAILVLAITPAEYMAVLRFRADPPVGAQFAAQNLMGVSVDGAVVDVHPVHGTDLWEITAWASDRHDASARALAAFRQLQSVHKAELTLIDAPVPPIRPLRPYRPAAAAVILGGLLLLVLPGWLLLRTRRQAAMDTDALEVSWRRDHRRVVELGIVFVVLVSAAGIARIIRDRNAMPAGTVQRAGTLPPPVPTDIPPALQLPLEATPAPAAINPLQQAFTHLAGRRFREALAAVDECIEVVKATPVLRLAWRSEDHGRVFSDPVIPRLLALKAVLAAGADDPRQLRAALDAGESAWPREGPVGLFQVWVRHYRADAPEITDELTIDAKELRGLRAGDAPVITLRRRPKASGQAEEVSLLRDGWWDVR